MSGKLTVLDIPAPPGLPVNLVECLWVFSCSLLEEVSFDEGVGGHGVQFHHLDVARVDILLELLSVLTDEASRVRFHHFGIFFLFELALQVLVCQEKRTVDFAGHRLLEVLLLR